MKIPYTRTKLLFEPRDIWIGIYWKRYPKAIQMYVCLFPMLPISFYIHWQ